MAPLLPDTSGALVPLLQKRVRDPRAGYQQTMDVLKAAKSVGVYTKSSIMLGFGEKDEEIVQTMRDLKDAGVDIFTLGQYLQARQATAADLRCRFACMFACGSSIRDRQSLRLGGAASGRSRKLWLVCLGGRFFVPLAAKIPWCASEAHQASPGGERICHPREV